MLEGPIVGQVNQPPVKLKPSSIVNKVVIGSINVPAQLDSVVEVAPVPQV